jgi:hypothetical protein
MQGYSKSRLGPFTTVRYNGYLEASMQGYSKGSVVPSITAPYNG